MLSRQMKFFDAPIIRRGILAAALACSLGSAGAATLLFDEAPNGAVGGSLRGIVGRPQEDDGGIEIGNGGGSGIRGGNNDNNGGGNGGGRNGGNGDRGSGRGPILVARSDCTIQVACLLQIPGNTAPHMAEDEIFECELDPSDDPGGRSGSTRKLKLNARQDAAMRKMLRMGRLVPGYSKLRLDGDDGIMGDVEFDGTEVMLGEDFDVEARVDKAAGRSNYGNGNDNGNGGGMSGRRHPGLPFDRHRDLLLDENDDNNFGEHVGLKPMLVVRVTDVDGLARTESAEEIGDDVYGTLGDPVTMKSQLEDCSMGKLTVGVGVEEHADRYASNDAPGVLEIDIGISLVSNDRITIQNAVTAAVNDRLNVELPGPYEQVMYVLEKCYVGCSWAAYAYINGWMSVYQDVYYKHVGVQVHELGHNFGLAHSGGLDGLTYTDHTGMMGNPLYSDDVGRMCYNAAKTWQIGWYDDRKLTIDPLVDGPTSLEMVGIADYLDPETDDLPVVLKLETGTAMDFFVAFNRATGVNAQNDEADDELTIVEQGANGEGFSQSFLRGHLLAGESHVLANFAGSGIDVAVRLDGIENYGSAATDDDNVWRARVFVGTSGTAAPTLKPTFSPTDEPMNPPSPCFVVADGAAGMSVTVDILTDNYPGETTWTLSSECDAGFADISSPSYSAPGSQYSETYCVPWGRYAFAIADKYGDGMCCGYGNGGYEVRYEGGGSGALSGGDFGSGETRTFGAPCPPTGPPAPVPTQIPTKSPTSPPTEEPTISPTTEPTYLPTKGPTHFPTGNPTLSPTENPASLPTKSPTPLPTENPTPLPSISPTLSPTQKPTSTPTNHPTSAPTDSPTLSPTETRTTSPSKNPTASPAKEPTALPTKNSTAPPTKSPTPLPSESPTPLPSESPTLLPTMNPTPDPTDDPTSQPTSKAPTHAPTLVPTPMPTNDPTPSPTVTASTPCTGMYVDIQVITDNFPHETSWALNDTCTGEMTHSSPSPSPYVSKLMQYSQSVCLPPSRYTFIMYDSFGDGICCGHGEGSYNVTYDGNVVATGREFGSSEVSATFGSCLPATPPPTQTPQPTAGPTPGPTSPQLFATYDPSLGAPRCSSVGGSCSSGVLLDGKAPNREPNPPNTLDACEDGTKGGYHSDESIDRITVSAVGGGVLTAGGLAEIEAIVWAYGNGSGDTADFYYTANANNPRWAFIGSVAAAGPQLRTLTIQYIVPANNELQAVRVNFRWGGGASACSGGQYDDTDDLVFPVAIAGSIGKVMTTGNHQPANAPPLIPQRIDCFSIDRQDRCAASSPACRWQQKGKDRGCKPQ